ncbi:uncharacterized protein LOC109728458 isoform X1 [Ananas comosus]|uniref:Uncharacterized protein LOC109728458 isoform X1 n=2 Tax=Ananas comosus TaxID=4615 RepID=A0A6P5HJT2_ANACO|nr:uncharacterized protein LOC109728458 isoform X1 [Ananas comosus]
MNMMALTVRLAWDPSEERATKRMGVQVAAGSRLHLSQLLPHGLSSSSSSSSSVQAFAASVGSSVSSTRKAAFHGSDRSIACQVVALRSPFLGTGYSKLLRTRPSDARGRGGQPAPPRPFNARLPGSDDEGEEGEFARRLREFARRLRNEDADGFVVDPDLRNEDAAGRCGSSHFPSASPFSAADEHGTVRPWLVRGPEWPDRDDMVVAATVERKANSVEMPLSLRIIKQKKKQQQQQQQEQQQQHQHHQERQEGLFGESACCCSVKKAFSSLVFIIRELHSYTLHSMNMQELLEAPQGILARVNQEIHASFVWLFQQVFSCTPTLMVSVMLLLADFTVYSMARNAYAAPPTPTQSAVAVVESGHQQKLQRRFDSASVKTFSVGRTASVGGGSGGGSKVRPVAGATDDGRSDGSSSSSCYQSRTILPHGTSAVRAAVTGEGGLEEDAAAAPATEGDEETVWKRVVEEASRMQATTRDESLMDPETLKWLVAPFTAELAADDDYAEYLRTELLYQQALSEDPGNPLLLCNFAQFLYLVLRDHDRSEYYFKRAVGIEPVDAESLSQYARFLWLARKDLGTAEENYLQAISVDPGNCYHTANYAHFLWCTGGDDTCYPLGA